MVGAMDRSVAVWANQRPEVGVRWRSTMTRRWFFQPAFNCSEFSRLRGGSALLLGPVFYQARSSVFNHLLAVALINHYRSLKITVFEFALEGANCTQLDSMGNSVTEKWHFT